MSTVVITGADGFIGSHLCRAYSEAGYDVAALVLPDSPTAGRIKNLQGVTVLPCDFQNLVGIASQIPQEPAAFYHLAWGGVSPEERNSIQVQFPNLQLSLDAVQLAGTIRAKRFVLPGSTMEYMYGDGEITGHDVPTPQNLYGATKIAARYLCEALARQIKVPFIYAVITGVYGADRRDNNVIFYVIDQLLSKKKPALTELRQKWDYIHIDDLTQALILIGQKGIPGKCYAVGHGDNISLSEYVIQIRDMIDPALPLGIGEIPYQSECLPRSCIDISELQRDTGFEPKISFPVGINNVIDQIRNFKE